ncbi:hypothetical protein EDD18DRAFT_1355183 [Armillaria luteobubalina]|uniref:Uncharacterized protein n=1 Tax=Armillaria luteobubalina TaxID=153913 RepID=A0AA39URP6_9AGAR|nr:hypothetical protein EDD18DRAFT_1355183 [Armillaria luteobubalina]
MPKKKKAGAAATNRENIKHGILDPKESSAIAADPMYVHTDFVQEEDMPIRSYSYKPVHTFDFTFRLAQNCTVAADSWPSNTTNPVSQDRSQGTSSHSQASAKKFWDPDLKPDWETHEICTENRKRGREEADLVHDLPSGSSHTSAWCNGNGKTKKA